MLVLVFKALSFCLCLYLCLVTFEICEPNAFFKNIVFEALCPCLCESIHGVQSLGLDISKGTSPVKKQAHKAR